MTTTKLRLQYGALQVEFEGSEEFVKAELKDLLSHISKLPQFGSNTGAPNQTGTNQATAKPTQTSANSTPIASTSVVAQKLGVTSGPDLIMAACAYLTIGKKLEALPRKDIIEEMKKATAYYKQTYLNNLSAYLVTLTKAGNLHQLAGDSYSLPADKRAEIEAKLAN